MKSLIPLLASLAIVSGCSTLEVTNTTPDGREFTARAWSFLWDRNLEGLQFNYEKGTLEVINMRSTPDKETLAKGFDMMKSGLELMKQAL
jgi:hypothetical protein